MFEEEATTWKEKLTRAVFAFFLFIIVSMLIVTFLPGDAEQSLIGAITGTSSTKAGSIAGRSVPADYFNAARRECYYRYQQYSKDLANSEDTLRSCAFATTRELFIFGDIAKAIGYSVSETSIKRDISAQARQIYKESSSQAGFSEEESQPLDQIYRQILRSVPMNYRIDTQVAYSLFPAFLNQKLEPSAEELKVEQEAKSAKLSFRLVAFTEVNLLNQIEAKLTIPETELLAEYEKEKKESIANKEENFPSFETRKPVLISKLKFEKKRKELEVWKKKIQNLGLEPNGLELIAKETGQSIESLPGVTLGELKNLRSPKGTNFRLASDPKFWEAVSGNPFGSKKVAGPFTDNDKQIFIEFGTLAFSEAAISPSKPSDPNSQNKLLGFFLEINKSIAGTYNIEKQKSLSEE
ncbi:hypothetical protein LPTSP4_22990 [Leptospira ryugenii]|uniref:Uncharacterized protein n=1 Tax=Leptospira ryugenii TaxID=1917863 RepID=A0A2P2E1L8_9LEPT|nr:hypothetical protein [Leptospira ryugenii]GBF50772.1 hypothetical protein LPTSP4_22990 [Leptospira ryugenii]